MPDGHRNGHASRADRQDERFLSELARQLRADSIRCSTAAGSGHPTSAMSAADLMAVLLARHLRYDWDNPGEPRQRPPDLLQRPRLAAAVRDVQGGRRDHRRGAGQRVPPVRLPAAGPPHPGDPVGRRGHRVAGPGPALRGGHRAGRAAPGQAAIPGVGAVRRQRDGRGVDVGSAGQGRLLPARQPHRDRRREPARPARPHRAGMGHGRLPAARRGIRLHGRSSSTGTTSPRSTRRWPRRETPNGPP